MMADDSQKLRPGSRAAGTGGLSVRVCLWKIFDYGRPSKPRGGPTVRQGGCAAPHRIPRGLRFDVSRGEDVLVSGLSEATAYEITSSLLTVEATSGTPAKMEAAGTIPAYGQGRLRSVAGFHASD